MAEDIFGIIGSLQAGAFRVTHVVAEGGFGVVYRAHHEGFRADVALKCLKIPGAMSADQRRGFLQKFQEEGELLFRLSALIPAIVRPLHVGVIENAAQGAFVPFIALEWLEGESLDALVSRRRASGKPPLDIARAVRLLGPVARALECAHKFPGPQGLVSVLHRDLKPENLFLANIHGQETVKILDFGIGKVKSAATQIVGRVSSEGGLSAFTPAYGAPEQWLPKRYGQTGTWTDVWGFALTMVEVLIGEAPFDGDMQAVMGACIDEQQRPTPRTLGAELPDGVEAAFKKALAVDPRERYADIGAFWDAVEVPLGVHTPRIGSEKHSHLDSAPPPAAGATTPLAAIPDLQLEFAKPRPRDALRDPRRGAAPAVAPTMASASGTKVAGSPRRAQESSPDTDMQLMRNDAASELALDAQAGGDDFRSRPKSPRAARLDVAPGPPPPARIARAAAVHGASIRPSAGAIVARAMPALKLLMFAAAIMIADIGYAAYSGAPFTIGPARAFWLAGPLAVVGLFKLAMGVLGD